MHLLREHDDFRRLWLAQTISQIGGQISFLAVPLTAAVTLDATPAEMGLLTAMGSLPALVAGLFAGVIVDRRARRPILISADLTRALLLGTIPIAWVTGTLTMPLLYAVAFLTGLCGLFFGLAYHSYLPALVERKRLVEGNSALELGRSAAEIAGPAIAGWLVQLLKAPVAIAVDALSFVASAGLIARIRAKEPPRAGGASRASVWSDVAEGMRIVVRTPTIRALAAGSALVGLFNAMLEAVFILYLTRTIGMSPGLLGLVFAAGSVGFVAGALLPGRIVGIVGVGPAMAIGIAILGLSDLALPLAGHDLVVVAIAVAIGQFFFGMGVTLANVAETTLRQAIVPNALLGRVGGTLQVLSAATIPLGALLGGVLGQVIGLRPTLFLAALLETAVALWVWRSPLWSLRDVDLATNVD
ncbi:MAG: MFS transporter [Thermomicrobiales bacterium]